MTQINPFGSMRMLIPLKVSLGVPLGLRSTSGGGLPSKEIRRNPLRSR
jgi:hypothetical protein